MPIDERHITATSTRALFDVVIEGFADLPKLVTIVTAIAVGLVVGGALTEERDGTGGTVHPQAPRTPSAPKERDGT
ncbi:hypothetical protein [Streptomyces sp. NPDC055400]